MNDSLVPITVDTDRLINELNHLATLSDCSEPPPAVTRVVFTDTDLKARAYLRSLYEDASGDSYDVVRQRSGFTGSIEDVVLKPGHYAAFVELHVEQGPEWEAAGIDIGVVTAIAAPATYALQVDGQGGHAGAVLMPQRKDALCAAAEMILAVESPARASKSGDLVATVGELSVHPGAVNSIPSRVRFTLDIRDIVMANRDCVIDKIIQSAEKLGDRRGVSVQVECRNCDPPATSDDAKCSQDRC